MEEIKYKGYTIQVKQDDDPLNPRTGCDNLGTMACYHSRYDLGDKHEFSSKEEFLDWLKKNVKNIVFLDLFLLDHSGLSMSTAGFACDPGGWDTSRVGLIYVTKEKIRKEYSLKRNVTKRRAEMVKNMLRSEVETYDQYLTGDAYGYQIVNPDGTEGDSCWGFYGSDNEKSGLLEEAKNAIDCDITHRLKHEGIQEELALAVA